MDPSKILLNEKDIPSQWYNLAADLPNPLPPVLHPGTLNPVGPEDFAAIFPMTIIEQEVSQARWIDIPEEVRNLYRLWRPTPLHRAHRLEEALGTPARIYYKYEGVSPVGSHKPNTAVAQAYYSNKEGVKRLTTETGAGQWGSALALACSYFGLECKVYMVRVSYEQKPHRRTLMEMWGTKVVPSPSTDTAAGRKILQDSPDTLGSLGIAISEAVEDAASREDSKYALGSVLNHVLLHQTVIGLEAQEQMAMAGDYPDVVIACNGGGSNFAGIAFPYLRDKIHGRDLRIVSVEPTACPTLTRGVFSYDFGDATQLTPLLPMFTLGHDFIPAGIHAGGLRYHGNAPLVSLAYRDRLIEAVAFGQIECFAAAVQFARSEGILPAPESSHAIRGVILEAQRAKEEAKERVILFNLSGHGHFDLSAYDAYLAGKLQDYELPESGIESALQAVRNFPRAV